MVTIKIGRKEAIFLFALVVALVGFGIVASQNPSVFGHTYDDLRGVAYSCSADSTNPSCTSLPGGWDANTIASKASISENSNKLDGKTLSQVLASGVDRNLRVGSHTQAVNGVAYVTNNIDFSPACLSTNYYILLTAKPMDNSQRSAYIPLFEGAVDEDTFNYSLIDVQVRGYTGNVKVNYLVYCI